MNARESQFEPAVGIDNGGKRPERQAARDAGHVQARKDEVCCRRHHARKLVVAASVDPLPGVMTGVVGERHFQRACVDQKLTEACAVDGVRDERCKAVDLCFGGKRAAHTDEDVPLPLFEIEVSLFFLCAVRIHRFPRSDLTWDSKSGPLATCQIDRSEAGRAGCCFCGRSYRGKDRSVAATGAERQRLIRRDADRHRALVIRP